METGIIRYILPNFRSFADILANEESLFNYDPHFMEYIIDGNYYFSSISYLITVCQGYHLDIQNLIVENMLGKLRKSCNKYLLTKYVYTQGNYRNVQDWVNKMGMNKNRKWATDLEVFATALLFNIDIWGFLGWASFSGNGSRFDQLIKTPTSNDLYIRIWLIIMSQLFPLS